MKAKFKYSINCSKTFEDSFFCHLLVNRSEATPFERDECIYKQVYTVKK